MLSKAPRGFQTREVRRSSTWAGFKNALFGGEGLFLATLEGPGQCIAGVGGTVRDITKILGGD